MPLIRRVPKRGFRRSLKQKNQIVNIEALNQFRKDDVVGLQKLQERNLIKSAQKPVKVLGNGEIKKSLTVCAHLFSKSAVEKIKKAGGSVEIIKREKPMRSTVHSRQTTDKK